jgi:two-component system sensor histidine kinase YesM
VLVVKLSLQPLVENAIVHGLERGAAGLEIRVSAWVTAAGLHIAVADNGGGIDVATLTRIKAVLGRPISAGKLPTADVGIGITNIDRRVKLLFGEQYGLQLKVKPGVGTTITLHLPWQRQDGELEGEGLIYEHPHRGG